MTAIAIRAADIFGWATVGNWLKNIQHKMQVRALQKRTYKELQSLTDRELNDIGIGRSDIRSVSVGTFHDDHIVSSKANENLKGWV